MITPSRTLLLAAVAIGFVAAQSPAHAVGADPTVDFGSLKAEFAAEAAGATYGDKRRKFRQRAATPKKRGFRTRAPKRRNFSTTRRK